LLGQGSNGSGGTFNGCGGFGGLGINVLLHDQYPNGLKYSVSQT
jgi:hypothetical protein